MNVYFNKDRRSTKNFHRQQFFKPRNFSYIKFYGLTYFSPTLIFYKSNYRVVCEEFNNFQDSKSIFMVSDFKIFSIMPSRKD